MFGAGLNGAAVGIKRMLKKTCHLSTRSRHSERAEHVLGAVAVVNVEVDDGHSLEPFDFERIGRGNADVVEYAKAQWSDLSSHDDRRGAPRKTHSLRGPPSLRRPPGGLAPAARRAAARLYGFIGRVGIEL